MVVLTVRKQGTTGAREYFLIPHVIRYRRIRMINKYVLGVATQTLYLKSDLLPEEELLHTSTVLGGSIPMESTGVFADVNNLIVAFPVVTLVDHRFWIELVDIDGNPVTGINQGVFVFELTL
jgi:hypothetical protein